MTEVFSCVSHPERTLCLPHDTNTTLSSSVVGFSNVSYRETFVMTACESGLCVEDKVQLLARGTYRARVLLPPLVWFYLGIF
jgi:hypothetical protein